MTRYHLRFVTSAAVLVFCGAVSFAGAGLTAQSEPSPFDGRWVIPVDSWFERLATPASQGPGGGSGPGGRGDQAPGRDIGLDLTVSAEDAVSGRATGLNSRRGAPGSHPA